MEFKIAVIGRRLFGDLGLIFKEPGMAPQNEIGFRDDTLKKLLKSSPTNAHIESVRGIFIRNREKTAKL